MSLFKLKPTQLRLSSGIAVVIGVLIWIFVHHAGLANSWLDFVGGFLIGIGSALFLASFSEQ